ncbi:MAG: NUDIX domain-containing protein [Porticoccaceae bacterium]
MFGKPRFSREDVEILAENVLYKGFFSMLGYRLRHRLFNGGWGKPISRELFWRPQAVGVLVYDPGNDLVGLVEQFRIGALEHARGPWLLEVVAGLVEPGENLEEVAHRELAEEAGLCAEKLIPIHDVLLTPGGSNERIALYCGLANLAGKEGIFGLPEEGEDIRLHVVSRAQALEALKNGDCDNAPLTIALQWLALHYDDIATGVL